MGRILGSKNSMAFLISLGLLALGTGCTNSSDEFSTVLDDSNGGRGTASIAVQSYSPGLSSVVVKATATQNFLVVAVGQGELRYTWTLDDVEVGSNLPTYSLNAALQTVGDKTLKVKINDEVGEVTQEWAVKINGTPVISVASPSASSVNLRRATQQTFSVTVTDPNSDTLTYVWKLDGEENVLTSTTGSQNWTPATVDVGNHTVVVDVYDGPASDSGTYKVTQSWTVYVNHFPSACNKMENDSETNKACVYVGIAGAGDGLNPETSASSIYVLPSAVEMTNEGNVFIADQYEHSVWFWNRATSPSVTVLGVSVPINTIKVVAGVGIAIAPGTIASPRDKALRTGLDTPRGLHWDGSNLYISQGNDGNSRVFKVDSSGVISVVHTNTSCDQPYGITVVGTYLYVACYDSNHVRRVDLGTLTATTFAGTGTAGDPANTNESSPTDGTNGVLRGPYGVTSDSSGNVYVGEYTGCRVRLYNLSGGPITLFGTWTINNNMQRIVLGKAGSSCAGTDVAVVNGEAVDITGATNALTARLRHISLTSTGLMVIPMTNSAGNNSAHAVGILNFNATASNIVSGVTVDPYNFAKVFGQGAAGYLEGGAPLVSRYNNPLSAVYDPVNGDFFIADYSNYRFRRVKNSDGKSELMAGNGSGRTRSNAGQGSVEVGSEKMSSVRGLAYDSVTGDLFLADSANHRIRVVDRYGTVTQAVGIGGSSGAGSEENEWPTSSTMNGPRNLVLTHKTTSFGGNLVWADYGNHRIRVWNRSTSDATLFGVFVETGKVATIGGDGTAGNATTGAALQSAFNSPSGVAFDGTNLYVADTGNHCIKKIDANGDLTAIAGTCGNATGSPLNGPVNTARMNGPEGIAYYEDGTHRGLIIAVTGNTRVMFHRLAGDLELFGNSIPVDQSYVVACGGTSHSDGVVAVSLAACSGVYSVTQVGIKFCYSNYNYHNVRCVDTSGIVRTVGGPFQGSGTTAYYFPGVCSAGADYDSASPNYASHNGVTAAYIPSPASEIPLATSFMSLNYPLPVLGIDSATLFVSDYSLGLTRKVKVP
ncbi:MAG: hypothetical protein IT288_14805 [Bdellovibrionales bacterium]|nr:hypothetical protein [Bdellovibrionales bacterium]